MSVPTKEGLILYTRDGRRYSNAVLVRYDEENEHYHVMTDWGNILVFTELGLSTAFTFKQEQVENWEWFTEGRTVLERLDEQIEKLRECRDLISGDKNV